MEIRSIDVSNFRVIQQATLNDLPKVVGIWGRNGSGKSALLQSVVVLRNWFRSQVQGPMPPPQFNSGGLTLGRIENVVWKGGASGQPFKIDCQLEPKGIAELQWGVRGIATQNQRGFEQQLVRYFPPHRSLANRVAGVAQTAPTELGENTAALHTVLHWFHHRKIREQQRTGNKNEVDRVDEWLTRVGFGPASDREEPTYGNGQVSAVFNDSETGYETPFIDGGFGGVNFAPILLEGYSFRDGVLIIEEPEISLHPAAQADVFDFMVEMATERNHQVLFTSHSEYLLTRFARYTKEHGKDDRLLGVFEAHKDKDGAHFERHSLDALAERWERKQSLIIDLHTRGS